MKTSWIIGVVMLYLIIMGLESWATGGTTLGSSGNIATSSQSTLMSPPLAESTNLFSSAWAVVTNVAFYLRDLMGIFILWSPTVFSGYLIWVWWGVCFPVDVAMVFGIVAMVRGVHSA